MKKTLSAILILMIALVQLGSVSGDTHDTSLQIKAYKVRSSENMFLNLSVTDSITDGSQLNTIAGSDASSSEEPPVTGEIVLDEFIGTGNGLLVGTLPASGKAISDDVTYGRIIFSYRVEGNYAGSFDITISISPFKNEDGNKVSAYYDLRNKSLGLNGISSVPVAGEDGSRTTEYTDSSGKEWSLSFITDEVFTPVIDATGSLESGWTVSGGAAGDILDRTWIAREAVYAVIDRSTFDNAPEGSYKAYVMVSVKDNL